MIAMHIQSPSRFTAGAKTTITIVLGEPLLGLLTDKEAIRFQVASSGCTSKKDFRIEILESNPVQLCLIRIRPDPCDAFVPSGAEIFFTYKELALRAGQQFKVANPLGTLFVPY